SPGVGVPIGGAVGQSGRVGVVDGAGVLVATLPESVPPPTGTGVCVDAGTGGIFEPGVGVVGAGVHAITPMPVVIPSNTMIMSISHLLRLRLLPKNSAIADSGPMIAPVGSHGT